MIGPGSDKKKMFGPQRRKRTEKEKEEKIWSSEEKNMETEKEQNIWRMKIFIEGKHLVHSGDEEWRRKRGKLFGNIGKGTTDPGVDYFDQ